MKYHNKVVNIRMGLIAPLLFLTACAGNSLQQRGENQTSNKSDLMQKISGSLKTPKNSFKSLREIAEYVTKNYESYDAEISFKCLGRFVSSLQSCPLNKSHFRPKYVYETFGLLKRYEKTLYSNGGFKTEFTRLDLGPNFFSDGKINRYDKFKIKRYLGGKVIKD